RIMFVVAVVTLAGGRDLIDALGQAGDERLRILPLLLEQSPHLRFVDHRLLLDSFRLCRRWPLVKAPNVQVTSARASKAQASSASDASSQRISSSSSSSWYSRIAAVRVASPSKSVWSWAAISSCFFAI